MRCERFISDPGGGQISRELLALKGFTGLAVDLSKSSRNLERNLRQLQQVGQSLAAYISLLRRHIYEEDHIFFKMAEKELSKEEEDLLSVQFKKEDQKMGGQSFYEQHRKLLEEMKVLLTADGA